MAKAFGINDLLDTNFHTQTMGENWCKHIGKPQTNCSMLIMGPPKNGKTDYCIKLVKELAMHGRRVYYNSYEEGKSETLKTAAIRNNMQDVSGKVMFGNREPFDEMLIRLKKPRSGNVVVIDSWDYMNLTAKQYKDLRQACKNKMIIVICWAHGERPDNPQARKIEYMIDIIIRVNNWVARPVSRFGGNETFTIWEKPITQGQGQLFK